MPDTDGINGPFKDGRIHCAHCDRWITSIEDELQHRTECGPKFRAATAWMDRKAGATYDEGVARYEARKLKEDADV